MCLAVPLKLIEITGKALSGEWGTDDENGNGIPVLRTTNFTNEGVGQNSTNGTMYIANTDVNKDDIYNQINGKQGTKIPGTPYYGYVVYDQGSGDVIKIISDTSIFMLPQAQINPNTNKYEISYGSNIIAINTMGSQLSGNSQYMNDYLNDYLQKTFDYIDTWNKERKE